MNGEHFIKEILLKEVNKRITTGERLLLILVLFKSVSKTNNIMIFLTSFVVLITFCLLQLCIN